MTLYALALEASILLGLWLALAVSQREPGAPGRLTFLALSLAAVAWCLGDLLVARDLVSEVLGDRIKYAGALALPPLWLGVAAHAARLEVARRVPWFPLLLLVPGACLFGLLFDERWGGLFLTTVQDGADVRGPLWWAGMAYGYALVVTGSVVLIATAARWRRPGEWSRRIAVGAASLIPLAGNAAYVMNATSWTLDPTPVLLGVSLLALRSGIFAGGLLQTLSIAQSDLLAHLPVGVLVADRRGTVLDLNPAAERRLGIAARRAVGRSVVAILDAAGDELSFDISPVFTGGREVGQLILIDPPRLKSRPPGAGG